MRLKNIFTLLLILICRVISAQDFGEMAASLIDNKLIRLSPNNKNYPFRDKNAPIMEGDYTLSSEQYLRKFPKAEFQAYKGGVSFYSSNSNTQMRYLVLSGKEKQDRNTEIKRKYVIVLYPDGQIKIKGIYTADFKNIEDLGAPRTRQDMIEFTQAGGKEADCSSCRVELDRCKESNRVLVGENTNLSKKNSKLTNDNNTLNNENAQLRKDVSNYREKTRQDSIRFKNSQKILLDSIDKLNKRLNIFIENEKEAKEKRIKDSLETVEKKRLVAEARIKYQNAESKYNSDQQYAKSKDYRDSIYSVADVMTTYIDCKECFEPQDNLILAEIIGKNKAGVEQQLAQSDSLKGKEVYNYMNSVVLMALSGVASKGDFNEKSELIRIIDHIGDYLKVVKTDEAGPESVLAKAVRNYEQGKDLHDVYFDISKHEKYLNDSIYYQEDERALLRLKVLTAKGAILLWNLDNISSASFLLQNDPTLQKELNNRVATGEKYLRQVVASENDLSQELRDLLRSSSTTASLKRKAEALKNKKAKKGNVETDVVIKQFHISKCVIIFNAKTLLYKHYIIDSKY
jgi:hypothetical protein